jgi:lipopolysaccharide/colanic/teichoic acid biosynthesis glycosyltransferase
MRQLFFGGGGAPWLRLSANASSMWRERWAGLLFFAPVMAATALAILLEDGRPVLFRQQRLGRRRRPFTILKFRSMREGRVTRVGRILRATSLDELPQFVNILRGELSAVGPRPLTSADTERFGWIDAAHDFRWSVPPGLTGLAQIVAHGARDRRSFSTAATSKAGACSSICASSRCLSP